MSENAVGLEARDKENLLKAAVVSCGQTRFASLSNRPNLVMQSPAEEDRG